MHPFFVDDDSPEDFNPIAEKIQNTANIQKDFRERGFAAKIFIAKKAYFRPNIN